MQFNKYYLAAAASVLVITLIIVFSQRSDWDSNRYILSSDNDGNLIPRSESYFEEKENARTNWVTGTVNNRVQGLANELRPRVTARNVAVAEYFGPHNGASCSYGRGDGHSPQDCVRRGPCHESITCPGNTVPIQTDGSGRVRCRCATFTAW